MRTQKIANPDVRAAFDVYEDLRLCLRIGACDGGEALRKGGYICDRINAGDDRDIERVKKYLKVVTGYKLLQDALNNMNWLNNNYCNG